MYRSVGTVAGFTLLLGILVAVAAVGGGVATGPVAAQSTNETTIQHENPDDAAQKGDSKRVREWLSDRLTDRLRESSTRISQGQYESADDVFDEEFQRRVAQYVAVAGETDGGATTGDGGGEGAETTEQTLFERAQSEQTRLAALRAEYDETYTAYLEARQRGDSEAARQHARRLQELAREIRELGGSVTRTLESIENETGTQTEDIEQQVNRSVQTVTQLEEQVQQQTFLETSLTVTTNRSVAAVDDPVEIRGQLVVENESRIRQLLGGAIPQGPISETDPLADQPVRIRVGHVLFEPTTSANGTFTVRYRPAFVPIGAENVSVRYLPGEASPYLGSETNASLVIEDPDTSAGGDRLGPTMAMSITPSAASFGDAITVKTELTVDGQPVVDVPVAVTVGSRSIGENRTAQNGTARTRAGLPATISAGDSTVRAAVAVEDRVGGPVTATTALLVRETDTELSASIRDTREGMLVAGRLRGSSADGEDVGLASQPVTVTLGETTRTVRTDTRGRFEVNVPDDVVTTAAEGESVRVRASFDGSKTNLESARAETRLNASILADGTGQAGNSIGSVIPRWAGVGVVVVVLLALGGLAWRRRRRDDAVEETAIGDESGALAGESERTDAQERAPLAEARDALSVGETDRAVIVAYGAVRGSLTDRFEGGQTQTPREFLATCEARLDPEASTALHTLTEVYEQTVFAPEDIEGASQQALEAAQSLLEPTASEPGEVSDD